MNAHINYDLSIIVYQQGVTYPGAGQSNLALSSCCLVSDSPPLVGTRNYKPDYDRINDVIATVLGPVSVDLGNR